jgi:purine-nucleoside phosphorylase
VKNTENNSSQAFLPSERLEAASRFLRSILPEPPAIAVVLGSGLGFFAEQIAAEQQIAVTTIPFYPQPTVAGHGGQLIYGKIEQVPLIAIQGRVHLYEGRSLADVTFYVHLLAQLGIKILILTNAAGSVTPDIRPGNFVLLQDYISFTQIALPGQSYQRHSPFDQELINLAQKVATDIQIPLKSGIYTWTLGPSYETAAEIQAIRQLGGQVVGMSTVPEAVVAHNLGLRVMAISLVTNLAAGLGTTPITHEEVQETAELSKVHYSRLMVALIAAIAFPEKYSSNVK